MLELVFDLRDFVVYPFVEPTHFELCDAIEKIFEDFESPPPSGDVTKPNFIDFSGNHQRFIHNQGGYAHSKEQRKVEFVQQIDKDDNDVEALEDETQVTVVVVVQID